MTPFWLDPEHPLNQACRHGRFLSILRRRAVCLLLVALVVSSAFSQERDEEAAMQAALGHSPDTEEPERPAHLPDLTKGEPLPPPGKGGPVTWQMGPTGIIGIKNGGNGGDQIQVIAVTPGSPADGKLLPGDVLLGVQKQRFEVGGDINWLVGNAIIDAETENGKGDLTVQIWRDRNWVKREAPKDAFGVDIDQMFREAESGSDIYTWEGDEERTVSVKQMAYDTFPVDGMHTNIALKLEVMGTYSETSPWDCPVVTKVREAALARIAEGFKPDKRRRGKLAGDWPGVLALVASGNPEYVALAKSWVHQQDLCQDMEGRFTIADVTYRGMQSWHHGFHYLEMAIYYDATGDTYVLPEVRKRAIVAALGQNGGGSWGHTFAFPEFNGGMLHKCNPGYGAMNNAGGRCFFLLTLAKKAGIEHPEINAAIWRAARFFGTFVDKGCIPYGYHSPYPSDDSNGKNYGPAYAFYTLGMKDEAKYFSMHSANASFSRRGGHGSPTLWYYTPLSAHMAGPKAVQAYMRNMRPFYTLSRRHDGSFVFLGEQAPGIGGKGMRNATATVAMHLSAPLQQLTITGKDADTNFWMTAEEYDELLTSARGQIKDPALIEEAGKPWSERSTDDVIAMLDHFYPNMRRAFAGELGKRYAAGETEILEKILPLLAHDEARMRDGACKTLSACGVDAVLANMTKVVPMLKDTAEFVRMQAAQTIGAATQPGEEAREVVLLQAVAEDYPGMTMDNGNVRTAIQGVLFARKRGKQADLGKLATSPFQAGYDEALVRLAMEKIVTMDPQGMVPGGWDKEALLKLAGPIVFAAEERQMNDAMFGGARKTQAQALLRKHGYREATDADAANLKKRSLLDREMRSKVTFKDPFISAARVKEAPGLYRDYLDDLRLWQWDNPLQSVLEAVHVGENKVFVETPIHLLIKIIELDTESQLPPSLAPEVAAMFQSELKRAGGTDEQIKLCRQELDDLDRKNYFRKMFAMQTLVGMLGGDALDDVAPFLGHPHWRLRDQAQALTAGLVKQGGVERLMALYEKAQACESGLLGNWNAAAMLHSLADAARGDAAVAPAVLSLAKAALQHHDPVVREAAVQVVFEIGGDPELKTVFAFLRQASDQQDFQGGEDALLSMREDPARVSRASKAARVLLAQSEPPLRRSLAWVLGQFGGTENLAAIRQAAESATDDGDRREMVKALAFSPDREATAIMAELVQQDDPLRKMVAGLSLHRMVGRNGMGDMTDQERVSFARAILNVTYDKGLVTFLGRVHTAPSIQLQYDVMKMRPDAAVKAIVACAEGIRNPSKGDQLILSTVLTDVIEYIEVNHLRGGHEVHVKTRLDAGGYAEWKDLQARAGKLLLTFNNPEKKAIPTFDDMDLDI